jgi:hypothetical protein
MGTIASPSVAASLSPTSGESDAMLFGRVAGDVVTIVLGTAEVGGGLTMAGGGAAVGCGTTLCLASAPAAVPGIAVATYRVGTTASGAAGLGENLGRFFATTQQDELNQTDKQTQTSPYGYPDNPSKPPAEGFEWRGKGEPGTSNGNWYNPKTGEWLHYDRTHHDQPHYDYSDPNGNRYRIWPDGSMTPK